MLTAGEGDGAVAELQLPGELLLLPISERPAEAAAELQQQLAGGGEVGEGAAEGIGGHARDD